MMMATLASDPLFSEDALSGYADQKEAPSKRRQLKTYLLLQRRRVGNQRRFAISVKIMMTWINVKGI